MADVAPAAAAGVDPGRVGRWLASHVEGLTLPEVASSNAANIRASITRDGDSYVVNGHKSWSGGAMSRNCR